MAIGPHVSLDYHEMSFEDRLKLAATNRIGIRDHPGDFDYTKAKKPPYTDLEYGVFIDDAENKHLIYKQGGRAQKPAFDKADVTLKFKMDEFAVYVDDIAQGDEGKIIISGFNVANGSGPHSKQTAPGTPTVTAVRGEASGEIDCECDVFGRNAMYICIASEDKPLDLNTITFNYGQLIITAGHTNRIIHVLDIHRKKKITGLIKGKFYWIYYIVSNSAGVSQLSIGVEVVCG